MAVITGPERPTPEEQEVIDGDGQEAERRRQEMARQRLQQEVELMVSREEFDQQARYLRDTNYVYRDNKVSYRTDLKYSLPVVRAVPRCFEACASVVRVDTDAEDVAQAQGFASSTAAAAQARAAAADADAAEFVKNFSIVDEDTADASEVSTLPQLQRLLENMDAQAGRVVPNETYCQVEEGGFAALEDVGRVRFAQRLPQIPCSVPEDGSRGRGAAAALASPTDRERPLAPGRRGRARGRRTQTVVLRAR